MYQDWMLVSRAGDSLHSILEALHEFAAKNPHATVVDAKFEHGYMDGVPRIAIRFTAPMEK